MKNTSDTCVLGVAYHQPIKEEISSLPENTTAIAEVFAVATDGSKIEIFLLPIVGELTTEKRDLISDAAVNLVALCLGGVAAGLRRSDSGGDPSKMS